MHHAARLTTLALVAALGLIAVPAFAQTFTSGSTGADGPFNPTSSTTLTLPADGVFNFTTINIPSSVTVRFARNTANTPVTLLATGDVTISGTLELSGAAGANLSIGVVFTSNGGSGGPGGFAGGSGSSGAVSPNGGSGLGPGGGGGAVPGTPAGGGGFAVAGNGPAGGAAYGTPSLRPMIGGSGGGGGTGVVAIRSGAGGGGGGGAITIASSGTITLTGRVNATGGSGGALIVGFPNDSAASGGSGGAVRLVATSVAGPGTIDVRGGSGFSSSGAPGRVRVEAFSNTSTFAIPGIVSASVSSGAPTSVALINAPTLRIASIAAVPTPATPTSSLIVPDVVLPAGTTNPVPVALEAFNIPVGTAVTVTVKGQVNALSNATATLAGTLASSTAVASVSVPLDQPAIVSATASFGLVALGHDRPVYAEGEPVERVTVTATARGGSELVLVTKSGREVPVSLAR